MSTDIIPSKILHPAEIVQFPLNSNSHPPAQVDELVASRQRFSQYRNVVTWTCPADIETVDAAGQPVTLKKGIAYVLAGNGFHLASLKRQDEAIEVKDYSHLSLDEAILLAETDNAAPLGAQRMVEQLRANLERAKSLYVDDERMSRMFERLRGQVGINGNGQNNGNEPPNPTEVEAEKYHKRWQAKLGDVWQLGRHTIACLDSLDEANIKKIVGDSVVTFAFADPPYGINIVAANVSVGGGEAYDIPFGGVKSKGYVGGGARIKASPGLYPIQTWEKNRIDKGLGSSDGAKPFGSKDKMVSGSVGAANLIDVGKYYPVAGDSTTETAKQSAALLLNLYPDACHVWWGANYYTDVLPPSPCWVIWDKDNTGNFADCEMAWTNQPTAARIFEHRWNGMLKASEQGQRRIHPTQKPVALFEWCAAKFIPQGGVILDPFLGSGISVIGAERLGPEFRVIGFELEPVYISVILQRFLDSTGIEPKRVD